ncbi:hypothetical protein F5Y10DRAFT_227706 [Nemania abortiva]|nr:hypothetical protein F5Y10DRAFT_227706 [Nemania abortiva]
MTSNRNIWRLGDPIPPAYDPCKNSLEEQEYDLALSDPNSCFGTGTEEDPLVIWIDRPDWRNRDAVWAHNNFAKAIAKVLGFTHTWIITRARDQQYALETEGRKGLASSESSFSDRYLLQETDMHISLRLGTGLYDCRLAAHAYVELNESGNPEKYMTALARRFRQDGADTRLEFWRWENPRRRFLRRRPVSLGANWELHANVGPYLDTYRPGGRPMRDTYASGGDATPPRTYLEGDDFIEGAMTRDMKALVQRCHAAYYDYQGFHERSLQCSVKHIAKRRGLSHKSLVTE